MKDPLAPVDGELISAMAETIRHRGPDDNGVAVGPGFGLGHVRLSIIDLSRAGRQPLCNEDETLFLVFNGEIYNFQSLRKELLEKGHRFQSNTDSEVILHLYEEHKEECLQKLRGMFAFALYDIQTNTLFAARDRVGKKPFAYACLKDAFVFGSEIKAILKDPSVEQKADLEAIDYYLSYQYVPGPWTAFKGIKKLDPGSYLIWRQGQLTIKSYWSLDFDQPLEVRGKNSEQKLAEALLEKFREAVRIRLVSDVPVGAFLSGGVDSAAVVAAMTEAAPSRVKTFTIGFEEKEYDESADARKIAHHYGAHHQEKIVKPDIVALLPKMVWHYNEPFADSSGVPSFYLSQMVAQSVKVVLNGDGGDENFAGYNRYRAHSLANRLSCLPKPLLGLLLKTSQALLPKKAGSGQGLVNQGRRFLEHAAIPEQLRNFNWFCYIDNHLKKELYTPEFAEQVKAHPAENLMLDRYAKSKAPDFLSRTLDLDIQTYLPHDLLVKVDIATMAHSLEARSPFLDHELMELAARIPSTLKLKGLKSKFILKAALKGLAPKNVLERPKKGFGVPIDRWLRGELKQMAYDTLLGQRCRERGLFNLKTVKRLLDEHASRKTNRHRQVWALLMLELWFCMFLDS